MTQQEHNERLEAIRNSRKEQLAALMAHRRPVPQKATATDQRKLIISNIGQLQSIARGKPELLNIGSFGLLRDIFNKTTKGCNCNKAKELMAYRPQFETCFAVLSDTDKTQLKNLLQVAELCYYKKEPNGQLQLICF